MMNKTILYVVLAVIIIGAGWYTLSSRNGDMMMQKETTMMKDNAMKKDTMKDGTMMMEGSIKTEVGGMEGDSMMKK